MFLFKDRNGIIIDQTSYKIDLQTIHGLKFLKYVIEYSEIIIRDVNHLDKQGKLNIEGKLKIILSKFYNYYMYWDNYSFNSFILFIN